MMGLFEGVGGNRASLEVGVGCEKRSLRSPRDAVCEHFMECESEAVAFSSDVVTDKK